jgi:hypothetical protein
MGSYSSFSSPKRYKVHLKGRKEKSGIRREPKACQIMEPANMPPPRHRNILLIIKKNPITYFPVWKCPCSCNTYVTITGRINKGSLLCSGLSHG